MKFPVPLVNKKIEDVNAIVPQFKRLLSTGT